MIIDDLLKKQNMSMYKLSKLSGVPQSTISDICSKKASLEKCSAGTLHKIAKVLNVTVDSMLEAEATVDDRPSFENYKSTICHLVHEKGDIEFIIETYEMNEIKKLYEKEWYLESFYLLAMVDYLSRENNLPLASDFNDIRKQKLAKPVYPSSLYLKSLIMKDESILEEAKKNSIPEFMRFNIVENEVRNVI